MSDVKDYRLTIRVRNNRLLRRIEATRGFVSVPKWCSKHGFSYTAVVNLISMRVSPLRVNGDWREMVERLASMLRSDPADLFPPRQLAGEVTAKNTVEREVSETELLALSEPAALAMIEHKTPENEVQDTEVIDKLLAVLPERQRRAVVLYYTGGVDDVVEELGISRGRAYQILGQAEKRMRTAAFRKFHLMSKNRFHQLQAEETRGILEESSQ